MSHFESEDEINNTPCPTCGSIKRYNVKEGSGEYIYCSECKREIGYFAGRVEVFKEKPAWTK